jgi:hypothetical protein
MTEYEKLHPEAELWLEALESGRFKQARNVLCKVTPQGDRHCCLGVACVVAKKNGKKVIINEKQTLLPTNHKIKSFNGEDAELPSNVQNWLGLKTECGGFSDRPLNHSDLDNSLAAKNDKGANFKQIASLIRKHADKLFTKSALKRATPKNKTT